MPDLPQLLDAIRERPADESRSLALSRWLWDEGRDDESVAVRLFWPTLRDNVPGGVPLEMTLRELARHAARLGGRVREIDGRANEYPLEP